MAADDKEASRNENSGADVVEFASEILGGGDITDEEGSSTKENLLVAVATTAEVITAGIVSANIPKEKASACTD